MIALIQRVTRSKVQINHKTVATIRAGYLIFLGVFENDSEEDVEKITEKITTMRIMSDEDGKMNKSIIDTKGEILLVSQFTLCADITSGRRPSFTKAKKPADAEKLYQLLVNKLTEKNIPVKTGQFGAYMDVRIHNDGPVTIIVDSKQI